MTLEEVYDKLKAVAPPKARVYVEKKVHTNCIGTKVVEYSASVFVDIHFTSIAHYSHSSLDKVYRDVEQQLLTGSTLRRSIGELDNEAATYTDKANKLRAMLPKDKDKKEQ